MAVTAAIASNAYAKRALRKAWATMAKLQGGRTASILRYTQTAAGDPAAGTAPTVSLVGSLANLTVLTDAFALSLLRRRGGNETQIKEGERLFFFIDLPATGSGLTAVAAYTLLGTDVIQMDSVKWRPVEGGVTNDPVTQVSWARCRMVDRG